MSENDTRLVAVIGTGLAGLAAAHMLERMNFESISVNSGSTPLKFVPHVYERSPMIGMDASSIDVAVGTNSFRLDVPMRAINAGKETGGTHDRVYQLYKLLGVALRKAEFSYSFSTLDSTGDSTDPKRPQQTPQFIYEGSNGFRWPPLSFPSTLSNKGILSKLNYCFSVVALMLAYFHLLALAFFYIKLFPHLIANERFDSFCDRHSVGNNIRKAILEPLYAAVSTVPLDQVNELPIGEFLAYTVDTFGNSHFVATEGVQDLVKRITAPLSDAQIHLSTSLVSMGPSPDSPSRTRLHFDNAAEPYKDFDYVIMATQANQSSKLLRTWTGSNPKEFNDQIEALELFEYVQTCVVNHTDVSILPALADRRDLNLARFTITPSSLPSLSSANSSATDLSLSGSSSISWELPPSSIQSTHIISRTHSELTLCLPPHQILMQTTGPLVQIDESLVLSRTWYERAKLSVSSKKILHKFILPNPTILLREGKEKRGGELQGHQGIYFAGSWAGDGIPLLEGCVVSAERAVASIAQREGVYGASIF